MDDRALAGVGQLEEDVVAVLATRDGASGPAMQRVPCGELAAQLSFESVTVVGNRIPRFQELDPTRHRRSAYRSGGARTRVTVGGKVEDGRKPSSVALELRRSS